jgi:hypothetical protein
MTKKEFFNIGLPKWPALLVSGDNVTTDQAKEILIRTSGSLQFCSNDKAFEELIHKEVFGVKASFMDLDTKLKEELKLEMREVYDYTDSKNVEYRLLNLSYLRNSRVLSSWIGGPHGWCNWDGTIGSNNYNIGKYPGTEEVYDEWVTIAEAFPFLNLKSQLLSGETCEFNNRPLIEYTISKGKVKMSIPTKQLSDTTGVEFNFGSFSRERGCSIQTFKDALKYVKETVK